MMDTGKCSRCGSLYGEDGITDCGVPVGEVWCVDCVVAGLKNRELQISKPIDETGAARVRSKLILKKEGCPRCGKAVTPQFESYEVPGVQICEACADQEAWLLIKNTPNYPSPWPGCWNSGE